MVVNIVTKSLGLVLIATAHVVFKGPSQAEVTGILGSNVTLQFRFNDTVIDNNSHIAVYREKQKQNRKIAQCLKNKGCVGGVALDIHQNSSVQYHITELQQNHSGIYWVSLFTGPGLPKQSNKVQLFVQQENSSNTVSPLQPNITIIEDDGSSTFFSSHIITILVVSPVVLLAAVLPLLIWCLVRAKGKKQPQQQQQQPQQQNSNLTVQATVGESYSAVPPSLIYSVLDFAKRPSAVLDIDPNDTEYANVSYLQENRQM